MRYGGVRAGVAVAVRDGVPGGVGGKVPARLRDPGGVAVEFLGNTTFGVKVLTGVVRKAPWGQAVLAIPQDPIQNNHTGSRCSNRRTVYPYWDLVS
jgi:hypothetical protein